MSSKKYLIPYFIAFISFSLILFVLPSNIDDLTFFYIGYFIYFIYNIFVIYQTKKIFSKDLMKNSNFLSIPIINLIIYICIVIFLFILKLVKLPSYFIIIIIFSILFLIYGLLYYFLEIGGNIIFNNQLERKKSSKNANDWKVKIEILYKTTDDDNIKNVLKVLLEDLKYIDVTSNEDVDEIDNNISNKINDLKKELSEGKVKEIKKLLKERSIILKNNK